MKPAAVRELVHDRLFPAFTQERARLAVIDQWARWDQEDTQLPPKATREMKRLAGLAKTPWLALVARTTAQAMYVDGHRSSEVDESQNTFSFDTWRANDFDRRQIAIHTAALQYGTAYVTVLPGTDANGPRSVMRGVSPRRMLAFYEDPAADDWPMFALRAEVQGDEWVLRVYDERSEHFLAIGQNTRGESQITYIEERIHDAGVCPVVRYANLDLDGRSPGVVEPHINLAARINKTTFDRLLTQHFNSWKVTTATGIAAPESAEDATRQATLLRQQDILIAEDADTKFGSLPETPLDGFMRAYDSDVETLAAVTQVPATSLNGKVANLSQEAIAELRNGHAQQVAEWQRSLGSSHDQALRLAAWLEGDSVRANDFTAHVTWADTSVRSMAQAADALGKFSQMLGVPPQALWSRIPGVTKTDVEEWQRMATEGDSIAQLGNILNAQAGPVA